MRLNTLPRHSGGFGWTHPYGHGPFSPVLYADGGGDGGGSGSGSGDTGGTGDDGDGGSGDGGQSDGDGSGKAGDGKQGGQGDDSAATIKRLEKELADARRDAGKARTAAKQQAADDAVKALTLQLGKALGFVKDDDGPPDPAKLAEAIAQKDTTIAEREAQLRARDVELAVWSRAEKAGAKAGALLDSRAFLQKIADLNPADSGFTEALDKAIKKALTDNPAYALQQAGRSGGDLSGGTGESGAKKRNNSLAAAIADHYQT